MSKRTRKKNLNRPSQWLRYHFDNLMTKSTFAPLMLLLLLVIISVMTIATIIFFAGLVPTETSVKGVSDNPNFIQVIYLTMLRMLDPGVMSDDPLHPWFLVFMLLATVLGLFVSSILIAIVNSGVIKKINNLRKGKSFVFEKKSYGNFRMVISGFSNYF